MAFRFLPAPVAIAFSSLYSRRNHFGGAEDAMLSPTRPLPSTAHPESEAFRDATFASVQIGHARLASPPGSVGPYPASRFGVPRYDRR